MATLMSLSNRTSPAAQLRNGRPSILPIARHFNVRAQAQPQKSETAKPQTQEAPKEETQVAATNKGEGGMMRPLDQDFDLMTHPFKRMTDHMMQMQREMDSLMGAFGMPGGLFDDLMAPLALPLAARRAPLMPSAGGLSRMARLLPLELREDDKAFTITAEVPGFDKKDIKVTLSDDGVLTMYGEIKEEEHAPAGEAKEGDGTKTAPRMTSRRYSSFQRSVLLPEEVMHEGIQATTANGVLTVTVPKKPLPEPKKPKEIPVA